MSYAWLSLEDWLNGGEIIRFKPTGGNTIRLCTRISKGKENPYKGTTYEYRCSCQGGVEYVIEDEDDEDDSK